MRGPAKALWLAAAAAAALARAGPAAEPFVRRSGKHFLAGDQRFYYVGANCFYLAYFAQDTGVATNGTTWRQMSDEVLTRSRDLDLRVLRTWAFNEADKQEFSATHGDWRMQTSPGMYREQALQGLDYVLNEASELGLRLVLTLVNNWADYGGMNWYVTNSPTAGVHDDFYTDAACRQWYRDHCATLALRTNTINGRVYRDDPTIFAWELANEPHCRNTSVLTNWVAEMAAFVQSIDTNHLVTTGEEGWEPAWSLNGAGPDVDYLVIHCWPDWWWPSDDDATMYGNAMTWVSNRLAAAEGIGKPIVLEEFGRFRPPAGPPLDAPYGRNSYYEGWLDAVQSSAAADGAAAGAQFWMLEAADSGHDDGVGSVFPSDTSTLALIAGAATRIDALTIPVFESMAMTPDGLRVSWADVVGSPTYRVDVSEDLASWTNSIPVTTNTWVDPDTGSATGRFYRVSPMY